jgi:hypothetical protein
MNGVNTFVHIFISQTDIWRYYYNNELSFWIVLYLDVLIDVLPIVCTLGMYLWF